MTLRYVKEVQRWQYLCEQAFRRDTIIEARGMSDLWKDVRGLERQDAEQFLNSGRNRPAERAMDTAIAANIDRSRRCLARPNDSIKPSAMDAMNSTDETLGVEEAAALLRAETSTVMQFARRGDLPGTRIGKGWVFLREDVIAFLRQQIASDTQGRRQQASRTIVAVAVTPPRSARRSKLPILPVLPIADASKKSP
ncbi:MAG: helix-turn-helix domain-containing protein [Telluria sp.]